MNSLSCCISERSVGPTDHGEEKVHRERGPVFNGVYREVTLQRSAPDEQGTQTREILLQGRKETQEGWDEQNVFWNPEIQNSEDISTKDKLQKPGGNTFLKYGVSELIRSLLSAVVVDLYRKLHIYIYVISPFKSEHEVTTAVNLPGMKR